MPLPIVLGLDSARHTGWGLVQGGTLLGRGTVDTAELPRIESLARAVCTQSRPAMVFIEDNFFAKNVDTLKALSRIVGAWQLAFAIRGVPTRLVMPSHWQKEILTGLLPKKALSDDRKAACAKWVALTYKVTAGEDACDGIAIATWGARRLAYESRLRPPDRAV